MLQKSTGRSVRRHAANALVKCKFLFLLRVWIDDDRFRPHHTNDACGIAIFLALVLRLNAKGSMITGRSQEGKYGVPSVVQEGMHSKPAYSQTAAPEQQPSRSLCCSYSHRAFPNPDILDAK